MWERSFIGVSMLLGATLEESLNALSASPEQAAGDLLVKLRDPRRTTRAQAMALVAQDVAVALGPLILR